MGFYGNITNTSKTQFQFDRTYPNRATMETTMNVDGIYTGRYVLIEYDSDLSQTLDVFLRVYMNNGVAYTTSKPTPTTMVKQSDIGLGDIVYTAAEYIADEQLVPKDCVFWKCTSNMIVDSTAAATFEKAVSSESNYVMNFNIDTAKYGEGRGYDSTVWQKTYINGNEKYIQIAELNSVVPTFDISADAPTIHPIQPHFDTQSTNVYYKLHQQPQWGLRALEANRSKTTSQEGYTYPSDESVNYTIYEYDTATGRLDSSRIDYPAAIYYNKAGFDKAVKTYHTEYSDEIQVAPTGISGNAYNTHGAANNTSTTQPDIQEFKILLPSLGNTISDVWDMVYGYGQKVDANGTFSGSTTNRTRFRDVEWKDVVTDSENTSIGGMTRDLNTLAGCINKVHDLMGMIITKADNATLNEEWFIKNYIYEKNGEYFRIHKYPQYTTTTVGELNLPNKDNYNSDQEYNIAYEAAIKSKLQDKEYYLILDNTSSANYKVATLNEKSLSALSDSAIIGFQDGHGYEFVQIPDMPGKMATIYGLILQIKNLLEIEDSETRDSATVTGAINQLNDIIKVFEDLVPGEFLICDASGHVNSANWTTAQDYSYTNYNSNNPNTIFKNFNTKENRWISLSLDAENREIELKHVFNKINDTTTTADKNNASTGNGINKSTDDTLKLYTPIVDAMGHVVGKNIETVTLPYSFKKITTAIQSTANNNPEVNENSINAYNTQDTLNIATANKWIRASGNDENNTLYIGHEVHSIDYDTSKNTTSLSNENSKEVSFIVPTDIYDEAGHLISRHNETYKMPFGYGIIIGNANDTTTEASATYDTLKLDTDKWLTTTVSKDTVTFSHNYPEKRDNTSSTFDMNKVDNTDQKNQIVLETLTHDEAGHIINVNQKTVTLPYGYKIFKDSNTKVGISTASDTQDTFVFKGDGWIQPTVTEDKVTFTHIGPVSTTYTAKQNITPNFGDTFTIEDWHFDDKGHKHNLTTHTVQIPKGSLSAAEPNESDMVLQIKFTPESGAIETQRKNIAELKLAGYNKQTDSANIEATDTLGQALSKLQTQITTEKTRIDNLDSEGSAAAGSYISSIKQVDGKVSFGTTELPTYSLETGTDDGTVSFNGTNISVAGLKSAAYTNVSDILNTTFQYDKEEKDTTIAQLFGIVKDLATQVNSLSQELNELKNKIET